MNVEKKSWYLGGKIESKEIFITITEKPILKLKHLLNSRM